MTATLAADLRLELETIMDVKMKAMLLEFEACLARAATEGQISSQAVQDPPQTTPSTTDNVQESVPESKSTEICQPQVTRELARVDLPEKLSSRGAPRSARDICLPGDAIAYQQLASEDGIPQGMESDGAAGEVVDPRDQLYALNCFTMLLLSLNACIDVNEMACLAHDSTDKLGWWYKAVELPLNILFMLELCTRVKIVGLQFFHAKRNHLHCVIIVTQVVETVVFLREQYYGWHTPVINATENLPLWFRMVGVLRILRVFNILDQLDYSNELHLLIASMQGSMRSLAWSALFILVPMYVFGMVLTEQVRDFKNVSHGHEIDLGAMLHFFGSLDRSMLTLFWAIAGGLSWAEATQPLSDYGFEWTGFLFVLYVASMSFATLNVLTGVFVNSATVAAASEADKRMLQMLKKIFNEVDDDDSGTLTQSEFRALLCHKDIEVCLKALGIPPAQANHLFNLIDTDSSGIVEIDEFLKGCDMLQGSLKAIDFATYLHDFHDFKTEVAHFMKTVGDAHGQVPLPKAPRPALFRFASQRFQV